MWALGEADRDSGTRKPGRRGTHECIEERFRFRQSSNPGGISVRMKRNISIAIVAVLAACAGTQAQSDKPARARVAREQATTVIAGPSDSTLVFVSSEFSFGGEVVTGAPYSAEAVTETIQVLSDGNRIVRRSTATVYRDSQGRTRHETTVGGIGPYGPAGETREHVFINDPVAKVNYILNPQNRTARKIQLVGPGMNHFEVRGRALGEALAEHSVVAGRVPGHAVAGGMWHAAPSGIGIGAAVAETRLKIEATTESLGKQLIEGVEAEGKRSVATIPAGQIGNELPIEIVTETWYSPELKTVITRRHRDPRHGETTYRLANINRSEPAASLFQPPPDFTVNEGNMLFEKTIRRTPKTPGPNDQ